MKKLFQILFVLTVAFVVFACGKTYELSLKSGDDNITIFVGETKIVTPTYTKGATLDWASSDNSVVTVEDGVLTAVKVGSATITVTIKEKTDVKAFIQVTVEQYSISFAAADKTVALKVGDTKTVTPTYSSGATLVWSSSNTSVATVSNGVITAVAAGTATITATIKDTNVKDTVEVTVTQNSVTFAAADKNIALKVGETKTVTPTYTSGAVLVWTSSNTAVATVANGVITAVAAGTATITATIKDTTVKDTLTVTVTEAGTPVGTKEDLEKPVLLGLPSEYQFTSNGTDFLTPLINISSDTTTVLYVATTRTYNGETWDYTDCYLYDGTEYSEDAKPTTYLKGKYTFKYNPETKEFTYEGDLSKVDPTEIKIYINEVEYKDGDTLTITAEDIVRIGVVYFPDNRPVNEGVDSSVTGSAVILDEDLNLEAITAGTAKLVIAAMFTECVITINVVVEAKYYPAESVTVTSPLDYLETGDSIKLTATVSPFEASQGVSWSVDKPDFATIDSTGLLTAVAPGKVIVKATSTDVTTVYGVYEIEIKEPTVLDTKTIVISPEYVNLYEEVTVGGAKYVVGKNAFDSFIDAYKAVDADGTIICAPGEYKITELLNMDKKVTVIGPFKDAKSNVDRSDINKEAVIRATNDLTGIMDIAASGITFNGVYLTANGYKLFRLVAGAGNFEIKSSVVFGLNSVVRQDANDLPIAGYIRFNDNIITGTTQFILWARANSLKGTTEITFAGNLITGGGTIGTPPSALIRIQDVNINPNCEINFINNIVKDIGSAQHIFGLPNACKTNILFNQFYNVPQYVYEIGTSVYESVFMEYNLFKDADGNDLNLLSQSTIKNILYSATTKLEGDKLFSILTTAAEVEAKYAEYLAGTITYPVRPVITVTGGTDKVYLEDGEYTLSISVTENFTVTYTSSDEAIATVDSTGKVTLKAKGKVIITITVNETYGISLKYELNILDEDVSVILVNPAYTTADEVITTELGTFKVGANAFDTIAKAIAASMEGTTIYVAAGEYDENLTIPFGITLNGASYGGVNSENPSVLKGVITIVALAKDLEINGFKFVGNASINVKAPAGSETVNLDGFKFVYNVVVSSLASGDGFLTFKETSTSYSRNVLIANNEFSMDATASTLKAMIYGDNNEELVITDNTFKNILSIAIYVHDTMKGLSGVTSNISNNKFEEIAKSAIYINWLSPTSGKSGVVNIDKNEFVNVGEYSVYLGSCNNSDIYTSISISENIFEGGKTYVHVNRVTITNNVVVSKNTFKSVPTSHYVVNGLAAAETVAADLNALGNYYLDGEGFITPDEAKFSTKVIYLAEFDSVIVASTFADNTEVKLSGVVQFVHTDGFLLKDETGSMFVTTQTAVTLGDVVEVKGKLGITSNTKVVKTDVEVTVVEAGTYEYNPTPISQTDFVALELDHANVGKEYTITGKVVARSTYLDIKFADGQTSQLYISAADQAILNEYLNGEVTVTVILRSKTSTFPYSSFVVISSLVGKYGEVTVDSEAEETAKSFKTLSAALDAVAPDGTIKLAPGTYSEAVTISKPVTILGANAFVNPNLTDRTDESVITVGLIVKADNVTFNGVLFDLVGQVTVQANNFTMEYCASPATSVLGAGTGIIASNVAKISNLTVDKCKFIYKGSRGIHTATTIVENASITNSYFEQISTSDACDNVRMQALAGEIYFVNNTFINAGQFAIFGGSTSNSATKIEIVNNTFDGKNTPSTAAAYAISMRSISSCTMNVLYNVFKNKGASTSLTIDLRLSSGATPTINVNYNAFTDAITGSHKYIAIGNALTTQIDVNADYNYFATPATTDTVVTVTAPANSFATLEELLAALPTEKTAYDFSTSFSTYASTWSSSYANKTVSAAEFGYGSADFSVNFNYASKQSGTITTMPVMASKNDLTFVTVETDFSNVVAFSFNLVQWTTKNFNKIYIEYTIDGETWVQCSDTIQTPNGLLTVQGSIATATQVRLCLLGGSSSNIQIGINGIEITRSLNIGAK